MEIILVVKPDWLSSLNKLFYVKLDFVEPLYPKNDVITTDHVGKSLHKCKFFYNTRI